MSATAATVRSGDRRPAAGFDHPHASEEARRIAEHGLILPVQVEPVGWLHGTHSAHWRGGG